MRGRGGEEVAVEVDGVARLIEAALEPHVLRRAGDPDDVVPRLVELASERERSAPEVCDSGVSGFKSEAILSLIMIMPPPYRRDRLRACTSNASSRSPSMSRM